MYKSLVLFISTLSLFFVNLYAQEESSQKEMLSFVQYTAPYRFSANLRVGDKLVYAFKDEDRENVSIEVVKKNKKGFQIVEMFDGNVINYIYNPQTKKVTALFGTDEDGEKQNCKMLSDTEVNRIIFDMKKDFNIVLTSSQIQKSIRLGEKNYSCNVLIPHITDDEFSPDQKDAYNDENAFWFSENIPKMYPVAVALFILNNEITFEKMTGGCIKTNALELIEIKGERK